MEPCRLYLSTYQAVKLSITSLLDVISLSTASWLCSSNSETATIRGSIVVSIVHSLRRALGLHALSCILHWCGSKVMISEPTTHGLHTKQTQSPEAGTLSSAEQLPQPPSFRTEVQTTHCFIIHTARSSSDIQDDLWPLTSSQGLQVQG